MDLNLVVLSGTLAVAPELRECDSGRRRLDCLVTVRTRIDGRYRSDTIRVQYWDPPNPIVGKKLICGDRVWVAGAVQRRFRSTLDVKRSQLEIVASQVVYRPEDLSLEAFDPDQKAGQSGDLEATTT